MESIKNDSELWTKDLDAFLRTLVSLHGTNDWKKIAEIVNVECKQRPRTQEECKERWTYINYSGSKESWSEEEELMMLMAHEKHKNKWLKIAKDLKGRSSNSIKNRFYSIFRGIKSKIKRMDLVYASKLEQFEGFYIMSLIESYFERQVPAKEKKGKREEDFIFSLLKGLDLSEVKAYRTELSKHDIHEISLEDIQREVGRKSRPKDAARPKEPDFEMDTLFPIEKLFFDGKHGWRLPSVRTSCPSSTLTADEKAFIQTQFFPSLQSKESMSAGALGYSPWVLSANVQTSVFSSAKTHTIPAKKFEGFSDFTSMARHGSNITPGPHE